MSVGIERAFLRGARFSVCGALVGSVLVFNTTTADAFGLPKLVVVWVAALAAVVLWVLGSRARGRWMPWGRFASAVAVLVGVSGVATLTSVSRLESLIGSYERYGGLLSLVLFAVLALMIVGVDGEAPGDGLRWLAWSVVGAAVVLSAYVVLQALGVDFVDWREASGRAVKFQGGTMGNSDFAGGFLGIAAPFFVWLVLTVPRRLSWLALAGGGLLLDVGALVLTRSRGGVLAAGVGGLAVALLLRSFLPRLVRRLFWPAAGLGAAAVLAVLLVPGFARVSGLNRTDLLRTESLEVRGREWATATKVFLDRPVLGTGPDTFEYRFPRHRSTEDAIHLGNQIADKPHNVLLERAADTGVLGLAAYLVVVVTALAFAWRRLRELEAASSERVLLAVFTAGALAYLAQAFVSIDVVPLALTGWLLLGAVAALADPACLLRRDDLAAQKKAKARPARRPRPFAFSTTLLAGLGALGLAAVVLNPVRADADAAVAQRSENRLTSASAWQRAIDRNPAQLAYRMGGAFAAEALGAESEQASQRASFLQAALDHYAEARKMAPEHLFAFLGTARTTTLYAQGVDPSKFPEADSWWKKTIALDPRNGELWHHHALMINSWANVQNGDVALRRRAFEQLEYALTLKPGDPGIIEALAKIGEALRAEGQSAQPGAGG
jgi:O-antigen ligase